MSEVVVQIENTVEETVVDNVTKTVNDTVENVSEVVDNAVENATEKVGSVQKIVDAVQNNEAVAETVIEAVVDKIPLKEAPVISQKVNIEGKAVIESIVGSFDGDLNVDTIILLLPRLIKHVDTFKTLTGKEKKNMIISMLNHIVDITDGPGDDDILDPVIKRVIPSVIDLVLVVDNGKLRVNKQNFLFKIYRKLTGLFSCCTKSQ
tara:strand:+ start:1727 stop:2344 length:618 start_codon:yes stop_codon:yes gene_type:complete